VTRFLDYGPDWPPRRAEPPSLVRQTLRRALSRLTFLLTFWAAAAITIAVLHPHPYDLDSPPEPTHREQPGPMWHKTVPDTPTPTPTRPRRG